MKTLIVGESNPYSSDPRLALYPVPKKGSGYNLCARIMGLEVREYLRRFDRTNLCASKWSARLAETTAAIIRASDRKIVVVCGARVAHAFGVPSDPFVAHQHSANEPMLVVLPHPSGLCRVWNDPESYARAKSILAAHGVI